MAKFDSHKWIREFKSSKLEAVNSLNDPTLKKLRTLPKGNLLPPLNKWWEAQPEDLMSAVYWSKGQLPPRDPKKFEEAYNEVVKQLHVKYPIPAEVLPKLDLDDETEKAISMDAPDMNEAESNIAQQTKSFQPGDMWSNDFDYVGMLKFGAERGFYELGLETLKDLYESFTDVNYHTEAQDLGNAIDYMEDPGQDANQAMERIEDFLTSFRRACMKTLKSWNIKWAPDPSIEREMRG
tara:strand:- start:126 stop:836 length:711 start_codon:yes stop_codon:yes gene_type:complete